MDGNNNKYEISDKEVEDVKKLLEYAFKKLQENDLELIKLSNDCIAPKTTYYAKRKYERKLHEVCINHRLAVYIEEYICNNFDDKKKYFIDIEYNRCGVNPKMVQINNEAKILRPDIIVHTRMNQNQKHYLVVEAKKDTNSKRDKEKIKAFINDDNYKYQFGCTIIYGEFKPIKATLFYKNNENLVENELEYSLKTGLD